MRTLRVAAGQAPAACLSAEANVSAAVDLTREAAAQDVRLLVLPETFLTNYCSAAFSRPPSVEGLPELLAPLRETTRSSGVTVVLSAPLDRGGAKTLSSIVVKPDGSVTAPYDKQHLSDDLDQSQFVAGQHGTSIEVDGWEVALSVCYDGSFPEHACAAAVDGARLYVNSGAFFVGGEHRRDLYYPARALDNGIFSLFSGLTGECSHDGTVFAGGSAVYDPEGRPLARLGREAGLAVADLDPALMAATRAAHPMHAERRTSLGSRVRS
ncbi:carbon-nitrogen hydrolase family protein [Nocardioides jishulii]|uniref:Carbon-nitrogen hydrolase family protein n=1 Tax=Nocardioides jishulii TaxID=2575440 RepID=A0A4U2YUW4_9ACTN|nr:carbon-nitrogen hydrolase family protein [Nocardioides jishulii]QCX28352.1 carbon-nitrogen hydrolase family protein [Nocardioides jishulii]TKI64755.1 carbon-nitrogen hydrolase family protein [Nocardioides jishulii]